MKIPHDLGAEGRGLLRRIGAWLEGEHVELDVHEEIVLVEACRVVDRLQQLRAALGGLESLTTPAAIRVLAEERQQRVALANLLVTKLGLPTGLVDEEKPAVGASPASRRAKKAAVARWSRRDQRGVS